MKLRFTILLIWTTGIAFGQTKDSIHIVHCKEKYYLSKTCYDFIKWEEVRTTSESVNNKINAVIRKGVQSYKVGEGEAASRCDKMMEYSTKLKVVYAKHPFISYNLESQTYFKGSPRPYTQVGTLNFDARTGNKIEFEDLIDKGKSSSVDSLIIAKVTSERKFDDLALQELKFNLEKKEFNITEEGVEIFYRFQNYPLDVLLSYQEMKAFARKEGLLKVLDTSK